MYQLSQCIVTHIACHPFGQKSTIMLVHVTELILINIRCHEDSVLSLYPIGCKTTIMHIILRLLYETKCNFTLNGLYSITSVLTVPTQSPQFSLHVPIQSLQFSLCPFNYLSSHCAHSITLVLTVLIQCWKKSQ